MGNTVVTSRLHVDFMSELPKVGEGEGIVFGRVLGGGRFLKTLQCWHQGQMVVVKAYSKRDVTQSLREQGERLEDIRQKLYRSSHPNVLPFMWITETQRAAFLVRPYVHSSLRERMMARPFLTTVEKKWLTYQLLNALSQCHRAGIVHGDIKSNNVLVTSWNWLVITDFIGLKPTHLPEDNPADLSFFFDDDYDRRCYVAPERFYDPKTPQASRPKGESQPAMDIFSAGCVVAELFLDGASLFQISNLLSYRKGEYDPAPALAKLDDVPIRDMVASMICLTPSSRPTVSALMAPSNASVFPPYFEHLQDLAWRSVGSLDPDECINLISKGHEALINDLGGFDSTEAVAAGGGGGGGAGAAAGAKAGEGAGAGEGEGKGVCGERRCSGLVHVLVLVTSSMRSVRSPSSKLEALGFIEWASMYVDDDIIMQRLVPYVCAIVSDDNESSLVRGSSIHTLAAMLSHVRSIPLSDQQIFPQYLLPALAGAATEETAEFVRVAYAASLGSLAQTAQRFLDVGHERRLLQAGEGGTGRGGEGAGEDGAGDEAGQQGYDAELAILQEAFVGLASNLLSGTSSCVKRTLLSDVLRLCRLLGRERTNNSLLPLIITVLNDRSDWELRLAFFQSLVGVAAFVGRESLEHFILPCIAQALTDMHDLVVEGALASLSSLTEMGLFSRQASIQAAKASLPLLVHPGCYMNLGVVGFQSTLSKQLGIADAYVHLAPALRTYLRRPIYHLTDESLREALIQPVSACAFVRAIDQARRQYERGTPDERRADRNEAKSAASPGMGGAAAGRRGEGRGGGRDDERGEMMEEEDARKLKMLEGYIRSVAMARVTQQRADEQHVAELRQEQEALASEEWLQDEWDSLFGRGPGAGGGGDAAVGRRVGGVHRSDSTASIASGASGRSSQAMMTPLSSMPTLEESGKGGRSGRAAQGSSGKGGWGEGEVLDSELPLGSVEPRAMAISQQRSATGWRPRGVLIGELSEHRGAVSCLEVSEDNVFVASGSSDGTVKIWDCSTLDSEVSSRLTYSQVGQVTALSICERSHSFASGTDAGNVHIVRVDCASTATPGEGYGGGARRSFGGLSTVRTLDFMGEGSILAAEHYIKGSASHLLVATESGKVHASDLRMKQTAWVLKPELRRGLPCCVSVGQDRNWLVLGTSRGFFIVYDMRFQIDVYWWRHPSMSEITSIQQYPSDTLRRLGGDSEAAHGAGPWIVAASGRNQVSVWEVPTGVCKQHYSATPSGYVSDVSDVTMKMGSEEEGVGDIGTKLGDFGLQELDAVSQPQECFKAVYMPPDCSYLLCGGTDRRIRFWNILSPPESHCLGGPVVDNGETTVYGSEWIRGPQGEVEHVFERRVPSTVLGSPGSHMQQYGQVPAAVLSGPREVQGATGSLPKPPTAHADAVTCLAVSRGAQGDRLLSSGGDGIVKVWC